MQNALTLRDDKSDSHNLSVAWLTRSSSEHRECGEQTRRAFVLVCIPSCVPCGQVMLAPLRGGKNNELLREPQSRADKRCVEPQRRPRQHTLSSPIILLWPCLLGLRRLQPLAYDAETEQIDKQTLTCPPGRRQQRSDLHWRADLALGELAKLLQKFRLAFESAPPGRPNR